MGDFLSSMILCLLLIDCIFSTYAFLDSIEMDPTRDGNTSFSDKSTLAQVKAPKFLSILTEKWNEVDESHQVLFLSFRKLALFFNVINFKVGL